LSNYSCQLVHFWGESASHMIIWSGTLLLPSLVFPKPEITCSSVFVLRSTFRWSRTQWESSSNAGANLRKEDIREMNGRNMNEEVQKHFGFSFSKGVNSQLSAFLASKRLSFAPCLQLRRIVLCNLVLWSQTKLYPFSEFTSNAKYKRHKT
jgi:hypothetical protein